MAQQLQPPPPPPSEIPSIPNAPPSPFFSRRSARQFGLFAAGAGFVALSSMITRRSIVRRYKAMLPKFYQPNTRVNEVDGAFEALEALSVATINVFSIGMMVAGGLLWSFDISTLEDMRRKVRRDLGVDNGRVDTEAEQEMEEWMATVLSRMDFKEKVKKRLEVHGKESKVKEGKPESETS